MSDETFAQVQLVYEDAMTYGWVPSSVAKKNVRVQLPEYGEMLWTVTEVYGLRDKSEVLRDERDYKAYQGSTRGGSID